MTEIDLHHSIYSDTRNQVIGVGDAKRENIVRCRDVRKKSSGDDEPKEYSFLRVRWRVPDF